LATEKDQLITQVRMEGAETYRAKLRGMGTATGQLHQRNLMLTKSIAKIAAAVGVLVAAYYLLRRAASAYFGLVREGMESADEMKGSAASMAAIFVSFHPEIPFREAYQNALSLQKLVERLDVEFTGTGQELQQLLSAWIMYMGDIDLSSRQQQKNFIAVAEAIKSVTRGADFQRQLFQEIRALSEGQARAGSQLAIMLKAMGVDLQKDIPLWREQGTILGELGKRLGGFVSSQEVVGGLLSTQLATLQSIKTQILRAAFAGEGLESAYQDVNSLLSATIEKLYKGGKLTEDAADIVAGLRMSWVAIRSSMGIGYEILRESAISLGIITKRTGSWSEAMASVATWVENIRYNLADLIIRWREWRTPLPLGHEIAPTKKKPAMIQSGVMPMPALDIFSLLGRFAAPTGAAPADIGKWSEERKKERARHQEILKEIERLKQVKFADITIPKGLGEMLKDANKQREEATDIAREQLPAAMTFEAETAARALEIAKLRGDSEERILATRNRLIQALQKEQQQWQSHLATLQTYQNRLLAVQGTEEDREQTAKRLRNAQANLEELEIRRLRVSREDKDILTDKRTDRVREFVGAAAERAQRVISPRDLLAHFGPGTAGPGGMLGGLPGFTGVDLRRHGREIDVVLHLRPDSNVPAGWENLLAARIIQQITGALGRGK